MPEEKQIAVKDELEIDLEAVDVGLRKIKEFQKLVRKLTTKDTDYGVIPGTDKPTLLKPGAEKIAKLMNLADSYEIVDKKEDYDQTTPLFAYTMKCQLKSIKTGKLISEGMGQCNSLESKYRFRWAFGSDVPETMDKEALKTKTVHSKKTGQDYKMYRIDNDDVFSQINTILKMAKKRALVDAVLSAGRLSEIFTQDLEEMGNHNPVKAAPKPSMTTTEEIRSELIKKAKIAADEIGDEEYYAILGTFGYSQFDEIIDIKQMQHILGVFRQAYKDKQ